MVDEFSTSAKLFPQVSNVSRSNARLLLAEAGGRVNEPAFESELRRALRRNLM